MELYKAIMFGESGLSRRERELLATVDVGGAELPLLNGRARRRPPCRGRRRPDRDTRSRRLPESGAVAARARSLRVRREAHHEGGGGRRADIEALRAEGLDDAAISDAIQVVGYFNYVTRVADGIGIEDEPEWH